MNKIRTRLAPTPSGFLHLGNALSFVVTWTMARAQNGWVLLRIDDLDAARRRLEYLEEIFRALEWLELDYDEGPEGPDDFFNKFSQQIRRPLYDEALDQLWKSGSLYACTCSRKQIQTVSKNGIYQGTCRNLQRAPNALHTAWRVRVPDNNTVCFKEINREIQGVDLSREMGDFVVRQKNRSPAYQIASLIDDRHWDINFIVRGKDLISSTAAQMHLADILGFTQFQQTTFWHHSLITDPDGRKLSKSEGANAIKSWREQSRSPVSIYKMAAKWLKINPEHIQNLSDLVSSVQINNSSCDT